MQNKNTYNHNIDFSIVIPVYNSAETLEQLVRKISSVFNNINRSFEIVLTDDGSTDSSWKVIQELINKGNPIRAFRFMKNQGQHFALKCGLDNCVGKYAITMDDDLQHPPDQIIKLINSIESDPDIDVVIGTYLFKKHNLFRKFGTFINNHIQQYMFDKNTKLKLTSFRIINRAVLNEIKNVRHIRPRIGLILISITNKIKNIEVIHDPRKNGRSGYTLSKMLGNTIDNMVNYSSLPLRIMSYIGLLCAFISFSIGGVYFIKYLFGAIKVSGYLSTILVVLFSAGIILLALGLVGEYLSRIVLQQLMISQYIIREDCISENLLENKKN